MSMGRQEVTRAAVWARVSTSDQDNRNQVDELREWAAARSLTVVAEFITEDSAWTRNGNGTKGREFDRARDAMLEGARLGQFGVVLCWGIDRLSRRGAEDMLSFVRRLTDTGCRLWSLNDPWAESTADPMTRELLFGVFATIARFESERRSERTKAGLARRKNVDGLPIGRQPGSADKRPRKRSGYVGAWEGPAGEARRQALAARNRQRAQPQMEQDG
jgi:putative DNA-invertase from lambdoid prophage Rac